MSENKKGWPYNTVADFSKSDITSKYLDLIGAQAEHITKQDEIIQQLKDSILLQSKPTGGFAKSEGE